MVSTDGLIYRNTVTRDQLKDALLARSLDFYAQREKALTEMGINMREFERVAILSSVDRRWMDHIDAMDQLRDGIGLRAYAQRDPIVEYRLEGAAMYDEMVRLIQEDTLRRLYYAVLVRQPERREEAKPISESHGPAQAPKKIMKGGPKVGRNDPCPCGSGKKYKECCGRGQ